MELSASAQKVSRLIEEGKRTEARQRCDAGLEDDPDDANLRYLLGILLYQEDDYPGARQAWRQAMEHLELLEGMRSEADRWTRFLDLYEHASVPVIKRVLQIMSPSDRKDRRTARGIGERALIDFPGDPFIHAALGFPLFFSKEFAAAREQWLQACQDTRLTTLHRAGVLSNVAYVDAILQDDPTWQRAESCLQEAMTLDPINASVHTCRGAVLIRQGKSLEGTSLIRQQLPRIFDNELRALDQCFLAIGETNLGNPEMGLKIIGEAKALDPGCVLLEMAAVEVIHARFR